MIDIKLRKIVHGVIVEIPTYMSFKYAISIPKKDIYNNDADSFLDEILRKNNIQTEQKNKSEEPINMINLNDYSTFYFAKMTQALLFIQLISEASDELMNEPVDDIMKYYEISKKHTN